MAPVSSGQLYNKGELAMTKLDTVKNLGQQQSALVEILTNVQESIDRVSLRLDAMEASSMEHQAAQSQPVSQDFSKALEPISIAVARLNFKEALEPLRRAVVQLSEPQAPVTPPKLLPLLLAYLGPRKVYLCLASLGCVLVLSLAFMLGQQTKLNGSVETLASVVQNNSEVLGVVVRHLAETRPKKKQSTRAETGAAAGMDTTDQPQANEAANQALGAESTNR